MFHVMWNGTIHGSGDLVDRFMAAVREITPPGALRSRLELVPPEPGADARISWDVGWQSVLLDLHVRVRTSPSALPRLSHARATEGADVLIAPFLPRRVRDELERAGWSYWDATGNMLLVVRDPLIVVRRDGATKDPNPGPAQAPTRLRSLKGPAASEVMVALLANGGRAATIRDFARDHTLPVSTVSRVITLLREENWLEPTGGGPIIVTDRLALARRWAEDYSFTDTFTTRRYFSILGPHRAAQRLRESGLDYAVTGVQAAQAWLAGQGTAPLVPDTELWVYATEVEAVERVADLAPAGRDATIWVAAASFLTREHTWQQEDRTRTVAPWRTVGDLLSRQGRQAAVGEALAEALIAGDTPEQEHAHA